MTRIIKKMSSFLILITLFALTNNASATRGDEGQQSPEEQSLLQSVTSWTADKIARIDRIRLLKALTLTLFAIGVTYYLNNNFMAEAHEIAGPVETEEPYSAYFNGKEVTLEFMLFLCQRFLNITEKQLESYNRQIEFLEGLLKILP